jgi:hypothetical protein
MGTCLFKLFYVGIMESLKTNISKSAWNYNLPAIDTYKWWMDYRHVYTPKLLGCPIMFDPTVMITVKHIKSIKF